MRVRRLLTLLLFFAAACDDLNKPLSHPKSLPPIDGNQSSSGGPAGDGGATSEDGAAPLPPPGPSPAPTVTPQPGDIQL